MLWEVEYTDEFEKWWNALTESEQIDVAAIGGNKTGDNRWYSKFITIADRLYDNHIKILIKEGLIHD